jgi:hypothetical protein
MRFLVMVRATKLSESGLMPDDPKIFEDMGKFNEELVNAGIMQAGEGLHPSSKGARVRFSGKSRAVIDGPFTETKELIAGFWLWKVSSLQEALDWVKRCPNPHEEECEIEIRPVFQIEDKRTVVDGPFPETKELIAGFWLWKCKSKEEAVAWAKRAPSPFPGMECEIEIRQIYELEDFGKELSSAERQREERLRQKISAQ